jgi:hypothetical protein
LVRRRPLTTDALTKRVLDVLKASPRPMTAREVAPIVGISVHQVNSTLYKCAQIGTTQRDADFRWSVVLLGPPAKQGQTTVRAGTPLDEKAGYQKTLEAQRRVAKAGPSARVIVTAPPGSGKTHVLVDRLAYLVGEQGLSPLQGVLVLSFTRSAVAEIKNRLRGKVNLGVVHDDLRFVNVRTFDSWATGLLLRDSETGRVEGDYNQRIKEAVSVLSRAPPEHAVLDLVHPVRHVLVDEVQDLVGVRALLVRTLLENALPRTAGFTLFWDPYQAIYDYSLSDSMYKWSSEDLVGWVRSENWGAAIIEEQFVHNFRASGEGLEVVRKARAILDDGTTVETKLNKLERLIESLPSAGRADTLTVASGGNGRTVCVLCRSNGEVAQVCNWLAQAKVSYRFLVAADERALPAALGRVLMGITAPGLSEEAFKLRWQALVGEDGPRTDLWQAMRGVAGHSNGDVSIHDLAENVRYDGRWPDDLDEMLLVPHPSLIISTIHKAKGREFDQVVLLEPAIGFESGATLEDTRVLYVALTRGRSQTSRMSRTGIVSARKIESTGGTRWGFRSSKGNSFVLVGLPGDVDPLSFATPSLHGGGQAMQAVQDYIWKNVHPNDPVALRIQTNGDGQRTYGIFHDDPQGTEKRIGLMSAAFTNDAEQAWKILHKSWQVQPREIRHVRVLSRVTDVAEIGMPGIPPFWISVRLNGFGLMVR